MPRESDSFHDAKTIVYCKDDTIVDEIVNESQYKGENLAWSMNDDSVPFSWNRWRKRN